MTEQKTTRVKMVLLGWREAKDGRKLQTWLLFPHNVELTGYIHEENGEKFYFKSKLDLAASPGAMWDLAADIKEDGSLGGFYTSSKDEALKPKFLGHIPDSKQQAAWQAASRGIERMIEQRNREKKQAERNVFYEALDPLREAYKKAGYQTRHHILADVIQYITK